MQWITWRICCLSVVFLCFFSDLFAQISITDADMPVAGDTFRVSYVDGFCKIIAVDPEQTGPNYNWDFSFLTPDSQMVDSFVSVFSMNFMYIFSFGSPFDPVHLATAATKSEAPGILEMAGLTDVYAFFKNSSSSYEQVGFGASINSFPIPVQYDPVDIIYEFPMNFGNVDSSTAIWFLNFGGIYFGQTIKRVNTVDGWGTLTTPFGAFQTLRVKTLINIEDTIYLDSAGFGITIPEPTVIEYKWFGNNQGIPLLQINAQDIFGFPLVTDIVYRDSLRTNAGRMSLLTSSTPEHCYQADGTASAVVINGKPPYSYFWNDTANQTTETATGLSTGTYDILVVDAMGCFATASETVNSDDGPEIDSIYIKNTGCEGKSDGEIQIFVVGNAQPFIYVWSNGDTADMVINVPKGAYSVTVTDVNNCSVTDTIQVNDGSNGCPDIPASLNVPSSFSPNGDGINDKWIIRGIELYPAINVEVYNRWGPLMFSSKGYAEPWDGIFNDKPVTSATYYFIIILDETQDAITGTVTVVR